MLEKAVNRRLATKSPQKLASRIVDQIERNNELSLQMRCPSNNVLCW